MAKEKDTAAALPAETPTVAPSAAEIHSSVKAALDAQQKFRVRLPAARKGDSQFEVVGINGYNIQIKKGETVEVPEAVFVILQQAQLV